VCLLLTFILANYLQENSAQSIPSLVKKTQKNFFLPEPGKNLLLLLICSTQIARWMSAPFFTLYIAQQLHADNLTLGFIYASMALSMSLMTLTLGKTIDKQFSWHAWAKLLLIMALLLSGLSQWGFAFITKLYLAFGLSILWGLSLGVIAIILFSFLLNDITDSNKAKAVGLGNTALKLGNLLGIIAGTFIQAESMQVDGHFMVSFMVIGFFYLVLAIIAGHYK
jgi:predicted MFS family arabinose efflux permease